jgi:hypothetical protein
LRRFANPIAATQAHTYTIPNANIYADRDPVTLTYSDGGANPHADRDPNSGTCIEFAMDHQPARVGLDECPEPIAHHRHV